MAKNKKGRKSKIFSPDLFELRDNIKRYIYNILYLIYNIYNNQYEYNEKLYKLKYTVAS